MNEMIAVIYGLIQGLTEFLPVSSSGHLALLPHFLDFKDPGVFFDLAMHLGTALSITLYFYRDILALLKQVLDFIKNPKEPSIVISPISTTDLTPCLLPNLIGRSTKR